MNLSVSKPRDPPSCWPGPSLVPLPSRDATIDGSLSKQKKTTNRNLFSWHDTWQCNMASKQINELSAEHVDCLILANAFLPKVKQTRDRIEGVVP